MKNWGNPGQASVADRMARLTERQRRFVAAYVICLVGTKAARQAGYSYWSAHSEAHKMLNHHPLIAPLIAELVEARFAMLRTKTDKGRDIRRRPPLRPRRR